MKTAGAVAFLSLVLLCASSVNAQAFEWIRQFGTAETDLSLAVSVDSLGSIYVSGYTDGSLEGANAGDSDAFLSKYDASGTLQWIRQFGTSDRDEGLDVSADELGSIYVSGYTDGSLEGANAGGSDAFISKYDASGTLQWTRQFGTAELDRSHGVSADRLGNVYVSGQTYGTLEGANPSGSDAFISKYDASGTLQWTRQFGTSARHYEFTTVSADGLGDVYISGRTEDVSGDRDAFFTKYDASGTLQWTRQFGTSGQDASADVSADGLGNVFVSGTTTGALGESHFGDDDAYVAKYDASGTLQWTRQLGTSALDRSFGVSADGLGNVFISGYTRGSLEGTNAGGLDAFISMYDASGTLQWTRQVGTNDADRGFGVSADGLGNVYISGATGGSLGGPNAGANDAFVAKFATEVPEPGPYDYDGDGDLDGDDVDALVGEIVAGTNNLVFDLTADDVVDNADLTDWLSEAATYNAFTFPYLLGDANLDGSVNAADLNALGRNWLRSPNAWQSGDFTADGTVNANDLNQLALNWQQSIPSAASPASVPEPAASILLLLAIMATPLLGHRRSLVSRRFTVS